MTATQATAVMLLAGGVGAGLWEWLFCSEYRRQARAREAQIAALQRRLERMERRAVLDRKVDR